MSEYVLIYNGFGVSDLSRDDLETLFLENNIYPSKPTVYRTDLTSNLDGLSPEQMTIVLPGGSVSAMGLGIEDKKDKIQHLFNHGCKGLFVCAGAYLATSGSELFCGNYNQASAYSTYAGDITEFTLNILPSYKAMGSFTPNNTYALTAVSAKHNIFRPYAVKLSIGDTQHAIQQMYLGGCGFKATHDDAETTCEVIARYSDCPSYTFFRPEEAPEVVHNMPAIIRMRNQKVLLSGPHLETCVDNSKLLKVMQEGVEGQLEALPADNDYDPDASKTFVVDLLQKSL